MTWVLGNLEAGLIAERAGGGKAMPAGYSGTPLAKKLGFADGVSVYALAMPASVKAEIGQTAKPKFVTKPAKDQPVAHVFATKAKALEAELTKLRPLLASNGMIWVSWPKKAAKVDTDITEDTIRKIALPMGYVDVKVCAVDETWSGLKLVIRKSER
jgi:hypothetical protein